MHDLIYTNKFKKQYKALKKSGLDEEEVKNVIMMLREGKRLPPEYLEHKWADTKEYKNVSECHLSRGLLLVYKVDKKAKVLYLYEIGTHSELL